MKQFLLLALCLIIAVPAMAFELTEDQKKVLEPAVDQMLKCLENGEKEIVDLQKAYETAVENTKTVAAQPKKWYQKGVANPDNKAKKEEAKALKALKDAEAKVAVIKCNLQVLGKREITEAELKQAKGELYGYISLMKQASDKVFPKLEKANEKAVVRVERIPSDKSAYEERIKEHQAKIAELEASKAGKGTWEKTKINTAILKEKGLLELEEGKPAALDKELAACQKTIAEYQEALLKKTALEVALGYLDSTPLQVTPVAPVEVPEDEEEKTEESK